MQRCHRASGKCSAALSIRPRQASEMTSCTPLRPRSTRWRRNADHGFVLLGALADPQDLAKPFRIDGRGHQQRNVADLAGPAALHDNAVEVEIRMLTLDPPVPPGLDLGVDLLVQVRHRTRADTSTPQRLGDVLDPADRNPSQIHLDQRLLDRALAPAVTLDDGPSRRSGSEASEP